MNQVIKEKSNAAAPGERRITINTSVAATSAVTAFSSHQEPLPPRRVTVSKALENAVYGHIRAVRALGRKQISASEIASALSLPVTDVVKALVALRSKGVKIAE
jgi:hypothetical protein